MATKTLKILDIFETEYDDGAGTNVAMNTDGIVRVSNPPTDPDDVARKQDVAGAGGPYILAVSDSALTESRVFIDGNGIQSTDGGAGSSFTVSAKENEIDHNALKNYDAVEHRRWEESITQVVHDDNISESSVKQHEQALDSYPRRVADSTQPTPAVGELMIWYDSGASKLYILYNDTTAGVKKVELT